MSSTEFYSAHIRSPSDIGYRPFFLRPTFGRYHLNWSSLSVNHLDLIQLAISGIIIEVGLEKSGTFSPINFWPPLDWMNIHVCPFYSHTAGPMKNGINSIKTAISELWSQVKCLKQSTEKLAGLQGSFGMLAHYKAAWLKNALVMLFAFLGSEIFVIGQCFHAASDRSCPAFVQDKIKDLPQFSWSVKRFLGDTRQEFAYNWYGRRSCWEPNERSRRV